MRPRAASHSSAPDAADSEDHTPPPEKDEQHDHEKDHHHDTEKDVEASPVPPAAPAPGKAKRHAFGRRPTGTTPVAKHGKSKGAPKYDRSLVRALHATFWVRWWTAGAMRLVSDTLKTTTPLITKELLAWLSVSYAWHELNAEQREAAGVSRGVLCSIREADENVYRLRSPGA